MAGNSRKLKLFCISFNIKSEIEMTCKRLTDCCLLQTLKAVDAELPDM